MRVALMLCVLLLSAAAFAQAPQPTLLNINPSWSPDGRQLVFQSDRHGRTELYIVDADGTGERRLTWNGADDTHPAWSPDGQWIVFDSNRDGTWNLYLIRPNGSGERRLTHPGATKCSMFARHPFWSPDGTRITFDSDRSGDEEIYVMNADGTGTRNLTQHTADDSERLFQLP